MAMTSDITERPESDSRHAPSFDALVIGAGFSGLYQLLCLRDRLGLSVRLLEAGAGVGGTWYWNRYPGARCDSESHSYCYSFSDELMREWEWSERYPGPPEILRYLNHVADRFDLKRDIRFNTRVTSAHYDETANIWRVQPETGEALTAPFLITAVGCLSSANVPNIPGLDTFAGRWYHTGQWPHEGVDFSGKRVGLIGTGSTGIQAAPVIAETAAHLTVFQRTANYSVPARNAPLTPEFRRYIRDNTAEIRRVTQSSVNGHPWFIADRSALKTPPEERQALYEEAWENGGLRFRATFRDLLVDKAANDTAAEFIRNKTRQSFRALQHAGCHRATRGVDHRLHCAYASAWAQAHRAHRRSGGFVGGTGECGGQRDAAAASEAFLVSRRKRTGQAACLHAIRRRDGAL